MARITEHPTCPECALIEDDELTLSIQVVREDVYIDTFATIEDAQKGQNSITTVYATKDDFIKALDIAGIW